MSDLSIARRPTLGVVAIAKNEERDLPGFLTNLVGWADEIVIVDNESTDNTAAIAANGGDTVKLINAPMADTGFAGLRNLGIEKATAEWLLHMDIDERVPAELMDEITRVIAQEQFVAYRLRRLNFFLNRPMKGGGLQRWNQMHLAKRTSGRFEKPIHEEFRLFDASAKVGQLGTKIWHLNDESYRERMRKSDQYCLLMAAEHDGEKGFGALRMLWAPIRAFIKAYFVLAGFRDGVPGLIWALHAASAELRIGILRWDASHSISRESVESRLSSSGN